MNHDLLAKIARLALHENTQEPEWSSAAIAYFRYLRKHKVEAEHLQIEDGGSESAKDEYLRRHDEDEIRMHQFREAMRRRQEAWRHTPLDETFPFGAFKFRPLVEVPTNYLRRTLQNPLKLSRTLLAAIETELRRRGKL